MQSFYHRLVVHILILLKYILYMFHQGSHSPPSECKKNRVEGMWTNCNLLLIYKCPSTFLLLEHFLQTLFQFQYIPLKYAVCLVSIYWSKDCSPTTLIFFGMKAMLFLCNGILLNQLYLPRVNQYQVNKLKKVSYLHWIWGKFGWPDGLKSSFKKLLTELLHKF